MQSERRRLGPSISFHRGLFFFEAFPSQLCRKWPPGPKNGIERRVSRFYTICDKNRLLNTNIEKVTAVLVLRSWDAVPLGQVVPPGSDARWLVEVITLPKMIAWT